MGVPAEKASMVWATCSGKYHLSVLPHYKATPEYIKSGESIPAFTVADQQELLPVFIDAKGTFYLNISKCYEGWYVSYETESGAELISHRGIKLVDVLMDATEWLLSNGYKLNI